MSDSRIQCPWCRTLNDLDAQRCSNCNTPLGSDASIVTPSAGASVAHVPDRSAFVSLLRFIAWMYLILGLIGAVVIFIAIGTIETSYGVQETSTIGVVYSFVAGITAVVGATVLFAGAAILEDVSATRRAAKAA